MLHSHPKTGEDSYITEVNRIHYDRNRSKINELIWWASPALWKKKLFGNSGPTSPDNFCCGFLWAPICSIKILHVLPRVFKIDHGMMEACSPSGTVVNTKSSIAECARSLNLSHTPRSSHQIYTRQPLVAAVVFHWAALPDSLWMGTKRPGKARQIYRQIIL